MIDHISPSMLGLFCRCQEAFYRRYINDEKMPPGISACIGTAMHKGAEVNHLQKIESGSDLPLSDIQDAARDGYENAIADGVFIPAGEESGAAKNLAAGADTAVALAAAYAKSIAPHIPPVAVEEKLQAEVPGLPVPLLGIIDVLCSDNSCPDLKSSVRKWPAGKVESSLQPQIYHHLLAENRGINASMSFEVITHKGEHQSIPVKVQAEDILPVITRAQGLLQAVKSGVFLPAEPGHWMCGPKWCGYFWSCPHIPQHKKILPKKSA
ncbi:MAG: PD-(D/E)XK nuclease family protein [Desulfovibrionaceae bacterium]|nr:PD-(D/E)XK nuclease family protein [Desulfovibrionaceae bacterium]